MRQFLKPSLDMNLLISQVRLKAVTEVIRAKRIFILRLFSFLLYLSFY